MPTRFYLPPDPPKIAPTPSWEDTSRMVASKVKARCIEVEAAYAKSDEVGTAALDYQNGDSVTQSFVSFTGL